MLKISGWMSLTPFELWFASIWVNGAGGHPIVWGFFCFFLFFLHRLDRKCAWSCSGSWARLGKRQRWWGKARGMLVVKLAAHNGARSLPRLRLRCWLLARAGLVGGDSRRSSWGGDLPVLREQGAWKGRAGGLCVEQPGAHAGTGPGQPRSPGSAGRCRFAPSPVGWEGGGRWRFTLLHRLLGRAVQGWPSHTVSSCHTLQRVARLQRGSVLVLLCDFVWSCMLLMSVCSFRSLHPFLQ